jgi:hypothetical protein
LLLPVLLAVLLPRHVEAGGRRQIVTGTAEGTENWRREFNVSGMRPGTYNIIVNAKDAAGNEAASGPFDVRVDPLASPPLVSVLYPEANSIVRGDINIAGITSAPYGAGQTLLKLDDGVYAPVDGKAYWSRLLDAGTQSDGYHTIYAKAIDSRGVEGPVARVSFILDLVPPVIELSGRTTGDCIAGTVKITGRIVDANGVVRAALSEDGETFRPLSLSGKNGDTRRRFSFTIRSADHADGPEVYHIQAISKTGCSVTMPVLFFVDNQGPEIEILSPAIDEDTAGPPLITGRVFDTVGITACYYEWDGNREPIPLRPGDPFWTVSVPVSLSNKRALPFRVTAVDKSGNAASVTRYFRNPRKPNLEDASRYAAGTPEIEFITPAPRFGAVHGTVTVSGAVSRAPQLAELSCSLDGAVFQELPFTVNSGKAWFTYPCDFTALENAGRRLIIRAKDYSGGITDASPDITYNDSGDAPVTMLNAPLAGSLITGDFWINGVAFDDDGVAAVYYRILSPASPRDSVDTVRAQQSDTPYQKAPAVQSFNIPCALTGLRDGENIIEVFAEDVNGVRGGIIRRTIRVSTAPPDIVVREPALDAYSRGALVVQGTVFDLNGVTALAVSMDNGATYQQAELTEHSGGLSAWSFPLNTTAYQDGIYSLLIRGVDEYGVTAAGGALITIDNTPPTLSPGTGGSVSKTGTVLNITGQAADNTGLRDIHFQLINARTGSRERYELPPDFVIMKQVDISGLPDGDYILQMSAVDLAGNEHSLTRDMVISRTTAASEIALINPLPGTDHAGPLVVSGAVTGAAIPEAVTLFVNGQPFGVAAVDRRGIFCFAMPDERIGTEETVVLSAGYDTPAGERIVSYGSEVRLQDAGPVLVVESHRDGDVAAGRPWIFGRAFVSVSETGERGLSGAAAPALREMLVSLDNGKSFDRIQSGKAAWRFRLETGELPAGPVPLIFKAVFSDGGIASRRLLLWIDTEAPLVRTGGPVENSSHRDTILVYGAAEDAYTVDSVQVSLRPGGKAAYMVPQAFQGLFLDYSMLGATTWNAGIGLTFFDNNVKLLGYIGQAPQGGRYSGTAAGGKLIANILHIPLQYFFGPDWEPFTMNAALGANFACFTMDSGGEPLVMGAFLAQWEFCKIDLSYYVRRWRYFKSFSLYAEPVWWFASSDIEAGAIFRITFGTRISLFQ